MVDWSDDEYDEPEPTLIDTALEVASRKKEIENQEKAGLPPRLKLQQKIDNENHKMKALRKKVPPMPPKKLESPAQGVEEYDEQHAWYYIKSPREKFGVTGPNKFLIDAGGLLCADASLPGSNLATVQVNDNFMGISQEFVHSRVYADLNLTFYVDNDYTNLRIFEAWIDYIASGSEVQQNNLFIQLGACVLFPTLLFFDRNKD